MGIRRGSISTPIIADGLVFNMDPANRASTIPSTSTDKAFNTINISEEGEFRNDTIYDSSTISPSFAFDGTADYIYVYDNDTLKPTNVTCFCWFKGGSQTSYSYPLSKYYSGGSNAYGFYTGATPNKLYFYVKTPGGSIQTAVSGVVMDSTWRLAVGSYDGTTAKLYINGILTTTGTGTGDILYSSGPLTIGSFNAGLYAFNGNIGPVQIYNRALSSNEVLHNYNALKGRFGL